MVFNTILRAPWQAPRKLPKHVAITTEGSITWAKQNQKSIRDAFGVKFENILSSIEVMIKYKIPVLTFHIFSENIYMHYGEMLEAMDHFFDIIKDHPLIHKNQIKISVLGKWYDLPGSSVTHIKDVLHATKFYDRFFLNFCVNYSGQQEIVDACRIIAKRIESGKITAEDISKEVIKENLYTSYFLPPEIIIRNGKKHKVSDFLTWDSVGAYYHYTDKYWPAFTKKDLLDALNAFGKK